MYLCHSQTIVIAAIAFLAEVPEWQWHYDPALDSLYLIATSHVCLYIFFQRTFAVLIFSPLFNPAAPFKGIPLYMAHLVAVPPHTAQPAAVLPQPTPSSPPENNPSEMSTFSSSSSFAPGGGYSLGDLGTANIMESGFLSSESAQRSLPDLLRIVVCIEWPSFGYLLYNLGPQTQFLLSLVLMYPYRLFCSCPCEDIY